MSWQKTCGIALIGALLAATAYADVIPFFGRRTPFVSCIELRVERMPPGMVLLFLDKDGKLEATTRQSEALRIQHKGAVYVARESELTTPFAYKNNKSRLHLLRKIEENDIPSGFGRPPRPVLLSCAVNEDALAGYILACRNLPGQQGAD